MKTKTLGRIGGIGQTSAACLIGYVDYYIVSRYDYVKVFEALFGDYPIGYKIGGVAILAIDGLIAASAVPLALIAADGFVDMYKGTHHYLGMQIVKGITKNPQIETDFKGIDDMLDRIEDQ